MTLGPVSADLGSSLLKKTDTHTERHLSQWVALHDQLARSHRGPVLSEAGIQAATRWITPVCFPAGGRDINTAGLTGSGGRRRHFSPKHNRLLQRLQGRLQQGETCIYHEFSPTLSAFRQNTFSRGWARLPHPLIGDKYHTMADQLISRSVYNLLITGTPRLTSPLHLEVWYTVFRSIFPVSETTDRVGSNRPAKPPALMSRSARRSQGTHRIVGYRTKFQQYFSSHLSLGSSRKCRVLVSFEILITQKTFFTNDFGSTKYQP